jgi:hypothetical protein
MSEQLPTSHQDNILMLLCYDAEMAPIIANAVDEGLFTSDIYRKIAAAGLFFLEKYGEPIGDHLADEFSSVLEGSDRMQSRIYRDVLLNLHELNSDGVNVGYCMNTLRSFVDTQRFKIALTEAADMVGSGHLDEARARLGKYQVGSDGIYDKGLELSENPSAFMDVILEADSLGIGPFDRIDFGPEAGTVLTFVAPTGKGKSWFLVHAGKMLSLSRKRVLHITLEMSALKVQRRYIQAFLAISKRAATTHVARFVTNDKTGKAETIDLREVRTPTLVDNDIRELIDTSMKKIKKSTRVRIKRFPTNSATVRDLESWLDQDERLTGKTYDAILLDYLDLLAIDSANLRIETGEAMKNFRRLTVERNLAGMTASQTNRSGEDTKVITTKHLAEDYSKAATSDRILTYNQTLAEEKLGLARVFVAKNRDDESGVMAVISQAYGFGQFVLDASFMPAGYTDMVDLQAGTDD